MSDKLKKYSSVEDELSEMFGFDEEDAEQARLQEELAKFPSNQTPRQRVENRARKREEASPAEQASQEAAQETVEEVAQQTEQPSIEMFGDVTQIPQTEPYQPNIPDLSWFDPNAFSDEVPELSPDEWSAPQLDLIEFSPGSPSAPSAPATTPAAPTTSLFDEWIDDDDEDEPEEPKELIETPPTEPTPKPEPEPTPAAPIGTTSESTGRIDDAIDLILNLEHRNPELYGEVSDAIRAAESVVQSDEVNPKTASQALGFVIGSLQSLINKVDGPEKDLVIKNAQLLEEYYSEEAKDRIEIGSKLDEDMHKLIDKIVQGPKARPPMKLRSDWHDAGTLYRHNRAIDILDNNPDVEEEEAQQRAIEEWAVIEETIDRLHPQMSPEDKQAEQEHLANLVMKNEGLESFKDGLRKYIEAAKKGFTVQKKNEFYTDVPEIEDGQEAEAAEVLSGDVYIEEGLEGMPDSYAEQLQPLIKKFAELSNQFIKIGDHWQDQYESSGGQISGDRYEAAKIDAQQLQKKIINLGTEISSIPTEIKTQAFEDGAIFKEIHALMKAMERYYPVLGIIGMGEGLGQSLTESERIEALKGHSGLMEGGGGAKAPGAGKGRIRNEVIQERARQAYLAHLKRSGRIRDYFKKRREYYYDKLREDAEDIEKRRIRRDMRQVNTEPGKWTEAGMTIGTRDQPLDKKRQVLINKAIAKHKKDLQMLWQRLNNSWLPEEQKTEIAQQRYDDRVKKLNETLSYMESQPRQFHPDVVTALRDHIGNLRQYFNDAKEQAEQLPPEEKFKPGERTEADRAARLGISQEELDKREQRNRRTQRSGRGKKRRRIVNIASQMSNEFINMILACAS